MQVSIEKIHQTSMAILTHTGIKVHDQDVCRLLQHHGIRVDQQVVFFTEDQLMEWLGRAPERFTLHARNPEFNVVIGDGKPDLIPGYGCSLIIEPSGERRPGRMDDYLRFLKLIQTDTAFNINGGIPIQPNELPVDHVHAIMAYAALLLSDKCLMGQPGSEAQVEQIMRLAAMTCGGEKHLRLQPRVITNVNTHSPLQLDPVALDTLRVHARYRQPVMLTAGVIGGTTGPITAAGALALGNAEVLAGLAITQILGPGTPVIMGLVVGPGNMRTAGFNLADPGYVTGFAVLKALAQRYKIPCRGGGGGSSANGLTAQAGYEAMLPLMESMRQNLDVIVHCAGILDNFAGVSFEKFITDMEALQLVQRVQAGLIVDDENLALDVIKEVGHGGEFLTHDHTLQHFRESTWVSPVASTGLLKTGTDAQQAYLKKIHTEIERRLRLYQPPSLDQQLRQALDEHLLKAGVDRLWVEKIPTS